MNNIAQNPLGINVKKSRNPEKTITNLRLLLGIFVAVNYPGFGVGGFVCNLVFDLVGSYVPVLLVMGIVMLVIAVTFQFIINAANKVRDQVMVQ